MAEFPISPGGIPAEMTHQIQDAYLKLVEIVADLAGEWFLARVLAEDASYLLLGGGEYNR